MKPFKFLNRNNNNNNNNNNSQFQGLLPFFNDTHIYDNHIEKILENTRGVSWYGYRSYFLNYFWYVTIRDIVHTPEYVMVECGIIRDGVETPYHKICFPELFEELTSASCRF